MSVRIVEDLAALPAELDALGAKRVLVVTTPGRRFLDRLHLGDREVEVFDRAKVHVPKEVVDAAEKRLVATGADTVISLGGGSATGLGKALRLRLDVRFVAIPTTWSGSELTRIWGTTDDGKKQTGRDDRVRPDVVVHAAELFLTLPKRVAVTSLLNALAHPISALSAGPLDEALTAQSLEAIRWLAWALDHLLQAPTSREGHEHALRGMRLGADVLDQAPMGEHHKVAHLLGGAFGFEHGALHAVLLPHSLRKLLAEGHEDVAKALGSPDAPAKVYDALIRAGASRSLVALGADAAKFASLSQENEILRAPWVADALVGRRPSLRERRWAVGDQDVSVYGPELSKAQRVVIAIHGRGADAGSIAKMVDDISGFDHDTTIVAPQAPGGVWYPLGYRKPLAEHGDAVPAAIARIEAVIEAVLREAPAERTLLFGFSQGACLAIETFARTKAPLSGLYAFGGARIGPTSEHPRIRELKHQAVVLLGAAAEDPWIVASDVSATAEALRNAGAMVHVLSSPGDGHHVTGVQRITAGTFFRSRPTGKAPSGFGNTLDSEGLPNALPAHQNNPRSISYGLLGEHISGTGFTATRADNRKLWTYRIRPSAQHTPFAPLAHPTFVADWGEEAEPNLCSWRPVGVPSTPADFVDGIATIGGAGNPGLRRGYAIHVYAANRSMDDRAFCNADGDLLIVPWDGGLAVLTEAGAIDVAPGQILLVPRGLRFSVLLRDASARGYIAELYGRHFELPERGPVGANGLADARHFKAPRAWFEDRLSPGYRVTTKLGNALYACTQDWSPYDVVAWYGNHLPFVYDLMDFSPVANARVDHIDPSVHTVLHGPMDEAGASALDFVLFAPRWDASEHTFRPPYFHRNAVTEINGIIRDPSLEGSPFHVGGWFVTPALTPHGVRTTGVERALEGNDRPSRIPDESLWFQFETALPLHLTSWARRAPQRIEDWPFTWGPYRSHFTP